VVFYIGYASIYSSSTNSKVRTIIAAIRNRKAINSLNSGITSAIPEPLIIFFVAMTDGISTGIQIGIRRKERSRVLPSENITSPETKEPANESPIAPKKHTSNRAGNRVPSSRFKKIMENGINTHSTKNSSAVP